MPAFRSYWWQGTGGAYPILTGSLRMETDHEARERGDIPPARSAYVTSTPEPGTYVMMAIGLLALAAFKLRRRRKARC